jgi:hypothetical protein
VGYHHVGHHHQPNHITSPSGVIDEDHDDNTNYHHHGDHLGEHSHSDLGYYDTLIPSRRQPLDFLQRPSRTTSPSKTEEQKIDDWLTYYGSGLVRDKQYVRKELGDKSTDTRFEKNCYDILDDPGKLMQQITDTTTSEYKNEITVNKMKQLLEDIKNTNNYPDKVCPWSKSIADSPPLTYKLVIDWFIDELNKKILIFDQANDYHHLNFDNKNKLNIYKSTAIVDYFQFTTIINRELKNVVFIINSQMVYNKEKSEIKVIDIKLTGMDTSDYASAGFLDYNINALLKCDKRGTDCSLSNKKYCDAADVKQGYYNDYLVTMKENETADLNSKCFYKQADTKAECSSPGIEGNTGIWDTKCMTDAECPFFGAKGNRNYTNTRGGCKKNGVCELPLNMVNLAYRLYRKGKLYRPLCHNCKPKPGCIGKECSQCCEKQGDYPDYAFYGDIDDREKDKTTLDKKKYKVSDIRLR